VANCLEVVVVEIDVVSLNEWRVILCPQHHHLQLLRLKFLVKMNRREAVLQKNSIAET